MLSQSKRLAESGNGIDRAVSIPAGSLRPRAGVQHHREHLGHGPEVRAARPHGEAERQGGGEAEARTAAEGEARQHGTSTPSRSQPCQPQPPRSRV